MLFYRFLPTILKSPSNEDPTQQPETRYNQ